MTDYTKLIEGLRKEAEFDHNHETLSELLCAADAIEALQAENERLNNEMAAGAQNMRWMMKSHNNNYDKLTAERDQLQAKLDELQRQEGPDFEDGPDSEGFSGPRPWNNYAAPKALEPLTDEQSATLFQAVKDDPRSAKFSVQNWFTCGLVTAEAAHGITKGTP